MTTCKRCDRKLSPKNKSGFCAHHFSEFIANDPEWKRKRAEGIRRKFEDPAHREKMAKVATRNAQKYYSDPANSARASAKGKELYRKYLCKPDVRKRNVEAIRENSWKITEHWLGWCPEEWRPRYHELRRSKRMLAVDARAIVEREIADKEALSHVDSALDFLRRFSPVRKEENGYRVGFSDILRPSEVIRRAELRGWEPDRWAA